MQVAHIMPVLVGVILGIATAGALRPRERNVLGENALIQNSLDDQVSAWNRGDLTGFMQMYWKDDRLEFRSGDSITRGYSATEARYRKRYQEGGAEMGTLTFSEVNIETLNRDRAIVTGRWELTLKQKPDKPRGWFTLQLRKFAEGWKIISDHTSAAEAKS